MSCNAEAMDLRHISPRPNETSKQTPNMEVVCVYRTMIAQGLTGVVGTHFDHKRSCMRHTVQIKCWMFPYEQFNNHVQDVFRFARIGASLQLFLYFLFRYIRAIENNDTGFSKDRACYRWKITDQTTRGQRRLRIRKEIETLPNS